MKLEIYYYCIDCKSKNPHPLNIKKCKTELNSIALHRFDETEELALVRLWIGLPFSTKTFRNLKRFWECSLAKEIKSQFFWGVLMYLSESIESAMVDTPPMMNELLHASIGTLLLKLFRESLVLLYYCTGMTNIFFIYFIFSICNFLDLCLNNIYLP